MSRKSCAGHQITPWRFSRVAVVRTSPVQVNATKNLSLLFLFGGLGWTPLQDHAFDMIDNSNTARQSED